MSVSLLPIQFPDPRFLSAIPFKDSASKRVSTAMGLGSLTHQVRKSTARRPILRKSLRYGSYGEGKEPPPPHECMIAGIPNRRGSEYRRSWGGRVT